MALAAAAPAAALGATGEAVADPSLALWLAAIGALAGLIAAWLMWRRWQEALAQARSAEAEADVRGAFLATAGLEYLAWSIHDRGAFGSPGLAALLDLPERVDTDFKTIALCFAAPDATLLERGIERLRETGEAFVLDLAAAEGPRMFEARGVRAATGGGAVADLVWFRDRSERARSSTDKERDLARLTARHDRLQAMLDAVPSPVWLRDDGLRLVACNQAYAEAVEAESVDDALAVGHEFAAGTVADGGRALAARARETGAPVREHRHVVMGGSRRLVELTEAPMPSTGGGLGFARDITEVETAEGELARHIAAHGEVLEKLSTPIAIYGPDQRIKFYNSSYVELWRLEENWLRGEPTIGEVLERARENRRLPEYADWLAFKHEQQKMFTSLIEPTEEMQHLPDGTALRAIVSPHPFGGLLCTFEDVTHRLMLERSYNTLIEVQTETLDNLYEGVAVFGSDGRLKLSNPEYAKLWQLPDELLEREPHIGEVVEQCKDFFEHGDNWPAMRDVLIAEVTDRLSRSTRLERSDGSVLDVACVPLPDGGVLFSYLDVSDSHRVERALRERNEALETADQLKSEFIANVSYELRTPLNTIIGFAEILANQYFGELNTRQHEYAHGILDSSQRLLLLINDILDLAMIEAGRMSLELDEIEIPKLLEAIAGLTQDWARKQNLTIKLDCPAKLGTMQIDERRIKQALLNLVTNAIRFTPAGGRITLSAEREDDHVFLRVVDTGVGIDRADQERVFEKFERGPENEQRRSGVGLGLSLVRSFVELHGGRVDIQSVLEAGTTVTIRLPLRAELPEPAGEPEVTPPIQASGD